MEELKNAILVLISTYNGEKYIREQLDSIESQKLNLPLSILIRDDGSTDQTKKIIKEYQDKYHNIELIESENIGCNRSFFELFKIANGYKYYSISDQDDIWLEDKLQRGIDKINEEKSKKPILYGSCSYLMDENGIKGTTQKQIRPLSLNNFIIQTFIPGHSQIMNNELLLLLKEDIDYTKIYYYDDWAIYIAEVFGKVLFDNNPSTKYRIHNSNVIGYGKGVFSWIKERIKRFNNGDGKKIYSQIEYFYSLYYKEIPSNENKEILKFLKNNDSLLNRIKFFFITKLYRQKKIETLLFKIAYLLGKY